MPYVFGIRTFSNAFVSDFDDRPGPLIYLEVKSGFYHRYRQADTSLNDSQTLVNCSLDVSSVPVRLLSIPISRLLEIPHNVGRFLFILDFQHFFPCTSSEPQISLYRREIWEPLMVLDKNGMVSKGTDGFTTEQ